MVRCDPSRAPGAAVPQSIAVVGTGISGLTATYLLSQVHRVDAIFEAHSIPGMDSQSVTVGGENGGPRVDVPVRSFSPHYYPVLIALYRHLGLKLQPVDYSSSMCRLGGESVFVYRNFRIGPLTIPWVPPWSREWQIAREWCYFQLRCFWHRRLNHLRNRTFQQFCRDGQHSPQFYEEWLLPICSSMLSCSVDTVRGYPADILVQFFSTRQTTFFTSWFRVATGTASICDRLLASVPPSRRYYATRIARVAPCRDGTRVEVVSAEGRRWEFDHVVIATEAAHVLGMMGGGATAAERDVFSRFRYEPSTAIIHRDPALMPHRREEWRTFNSFLPPNDGLEREPAQDGSSRRRLPDRYDKSSVTCWCNTILDVPKELGDIFQTWNPFVEPAAGTVLHTATFQRAVHDLRSGGAFDTLRGVQGTRRMWFCGSYASRGMTLLEQAVVSAIEVADAFGAPRPWDDERDAAPAPAPARRLLAAAAVAAAAAFAAASLRVAYMLAAASPA